MPLTADPQNGRRDSPLPGKAWYAYCNNGREAPITGKLGTMFMDRVFHPKIKGEPELIGSHICISLIGNGLRWGPLTKGAAVTGAHDT